MIIPFKFFKGKVYTDEFTLPLTRRMSGRTIAQDLSNQPQHHGFYVGNTPLVLEYQGDAHIESVRTMTCDLQIRYANYVSINEQVIGFMQDFLNVHLSGISIIRLA